MQALIIWWEWIFAYETFFLVFQEWSLTKGGLIQHDEICLSMPTSLYVGAPVVLSPCEDASKWYYSKDKLIQSHDKPGFCIAASADSSNLVSAICDPDDYLQKFEFNWWVGTKYLNCM